MVCPNDPTHPEFIKLLSGPPIRSLKRTIPLLHWFLAGLLANTLGEDQSKVAALNGFIPSQNDTALDAVNMQDCRMQMPICRVIVVSVLKDCLNGLA